MLTVALGDIVAQTNVTHKSRCQTKIDESKHPGFLYTCKQPTQLSENLHSKQPKSQFASGRKAKPNIKSDVCGKIPMYAWTRPERWCFASFSRVEVEWRATGMTPNHEFEFTSHMKPNTNLVVLILKPNQSVVGLVHEDMKAGHQRDSHVYVAR